MDVPCCRRRRVLDTPEEATDRPTVSLDRSLAARPPGLLDQKPDNNPQPRRRERSHPCPTLVDAERLAHAYILPKDYPFVKR